MNKEIDLLKVALQLGVARFGARAALEEVWDDLPEKEGGFPSVREEFVELGLKLIDEAILPAIAEYTSGEIDPNDLPEPGEPEPDPLGDMYGYKYRTRVMNSGEKMSHRDTNDPSKKQTHQDIFKVEGCGRGYGGRIFLVWSNGDTLIVRDAGSREYKGAWTDKRKWQPGCGDGSTPGCEAYARVGSHPEYMDIYHDSQPSDDDQPGDPDSDWVTIQWRGDQSLDFHTDDSRDRTWWTEIHGQREPDRREWSRKFPLPKDVESARSLRFEFSDGASLSVGNPRKMKMNTGGPKYRPEKPGEGDSRKAHPKVGAVPGSKVTWVRYRKG